MTDDPMELLKEVVPELINGAMDDIKEAAEAGDAVAKAKIEQGADVEGCVRIVLEGDGGGEVYYLINKDGFSVHDSAPGVKCYATIATPAEAMQIALEEMGDDIEPMLPKLRRRIAKAPAADNPMAGMELRFHSVIKDTPDFDEVRTKICVGGDEVVEDPTFTLNLDYSVIEGLKERKIKPQQMMSKFQIEGDAAAFMQMGMDFMAKAGK